MRHLIDVKEVVKGPTGIEIQTETGMWIHLCFSDELDVVLDRLREIEPEMFNRWLEKNT